MSLFLSVSPYRACSFSLSCIPILVCFPIIASTVSLLIFLHLSLSPYFISFSYFIPVSYFFRPSLFLPCPCSYVSIYCISIFPHPFFFLPSYSCLIFASTISLLIFSSSVAVSSHLYFFLHLISLSHLFYSYLFLCLSLSVCVPSNHLLLFRLILSTFSIFGSQSSSLHLGPAFP